MNVKGKGINAERELIHLFWKYGWASIRVAGSGSQRYPSPDILAGNGSRKIALECKSTKAPKKYIEKQEIDQLLTFTKKFGAEPYIAVRFNRQEWYFLSLDDLVQVKKSFVIDLPLAKMKGMTFDEVIGNFS